MTLPPNAPTHPVLLLLSSPRPSPPPLLEPLQSSIRAFPTPPPIHLLAFDTFLLPTAAHRPYDPASYDLSRLRAELVELLKLGRKETLVILYGTAPVLLEDLREEGWLYPSIKVWQDVPADISLSRAVLQAEDPEKDLSGVLARWTEEKEGWEVVEREARKKADLIVPWGDGKGKGVEVVAGAVMDEVDARRKDLITGDVVIREEGEAQETAYYDMV